MDGIDLAAGAWEPEVLALRVKDYKPQWLDQLCLTGRIGWGRLSPPLSGSARGFVPLRSTPISIFDREHLATWLELSHEQTSIDYTPDTELAFNALSQKGAMFFTELVRATKLLPSRVAQALGELTAQGWATSDSFEGLRALLIPAEKRTPFADIERKRRHRTVTSVEFAGRWTLLRPPASTGLGENGKLRRASDSAVESFARVLLRRYGVVFRRLLDRESLTVSWYELGRVYRRLEARGEIRGGRFVTGVSGEQFALPEAIGLLRKTRNAGRTGELIVINATDPLNLVGILTAGSRITAVTANRILLRDGLPIAALQGGEIQPLNGAGDFDAASEHALTVGTLAPELRPYYA